jgi:ADP-heptose:LPS heptosyltransferase
MSIRGLELLKQRMAGKEEVPQIQEISSEYSIKSKRTLDGVQDFSVLDTRPDHAPNLIEEFNVSSKSPLRIIITQHQSPGDVLMLTATLRDIHKQYPNMFITDIRVPTKELFDHNPYVTKCSIKDPRTVVWEATYPLISRSNQANIHFIYAFHDHFERVTGLSLKMTKAIPDIHIGDEEKKWSSRIWELFGDNRPYWIIDAGRKNDFTTKHWEVARFQEVVDAFPDITFVQVGAKNHHHPPLKGPNLINEVGKTSIRQFVRLMYHSYGVITPVSFPMHLSAGVPVNGRYGYKHRPTIVIAGSREPAAWEAYSNQQYIHNSGMLPCSGEGGCWIARIEKLNDGDSKDNNLCKSPVTSKSGQVIPKCMDMIASAEVIRIMKQYHTNFPTK